MCGSGEPVSVLGKAVSLTGVEPAGTGSRLALVLYRNWSVGPGERGGTVASPGSGGIGGFDVRVSNMVTGS